VVSAVQRDGAAYGAVVGGGLLGLAALLGLGGCEPAGIKLGDGVIDTASDGDSDADTDTDTDTDPDTGDTADDTGGPVLPEWDVLVDCDGGGDFLTIQAAIDAATSGDRIGLAACEYHERIDYLGKYLDIFGVDGSTATVIDGDEQGTVVNVETAESEGTRLAGVTVRGGYDPLAGSALELEYAALTLDDVVFTGNADGMAVVWAESGWLDMIDVSVADNVVVAGGSAVYSSGGSLNAARLDADCGAGTYAVYEHNATLLLDSTLNCDAGYGLYSHHGEVLMKRSRAEGGLEGIHAEDELDTPSERIILFNTAVGGGTIGLNVIYMTATIANSVIWGVDSAVSLTGDATSSWVISSVLAGATCGITADPAYYASYDAFWNVATDGCGLTPTASLHDDPLFVSFPDDLTLAAGSPLVNAGYSNADWNDPDGSRNDIGLTGGPWAE
jgi:hypothetical protein